MNRSTIVPLCCALFLAAAAFGQEATEKSPGKPDSQETLVLRYYAVTGTPDAVGGVFRAAQSGFGRTIVTEDGQRQNLFTVGLSIGILETEGRAAKILKALPEMEAAFSRSEPGDSKEKAETTLIRLKYVEASGLSPILRNFEHEVPGIGHKGRMRNITIVPQQNAILLHDTPTATAAIKSLLVELDKLAQDPPQNSLMLNCQILRVVAEAPKPPAPLAPELVANLRKLGPWQHFDLLGSSIVKVQAPNGKAEVAMDLGPDYSARLQFDELGGPNGDQIPLGNCQVHIQHVPRDGSAAAPPISIRTRTQLTLGEFTVVGAAGKMPFLVVISVNR